VHAHVSFLALPAGRLLVNMKSRLRDYASVAVYGMWHMLCVALQQPTNDKEKINTFFKIFNDEYKWQISHDGEFQALIDYLQGLGGCLSIAFNNHEILEMAKEFGSIPKDATERQEDAILENYWRFMANKLIQLKKRVK
jgi:hypothetical protein